jgi:type IV fimbrial biogenesis protein FimT
MESRMEDWMAAGRKLGASRRHGAGAESGRRFRVGLLRRPAIEGSLQPAAVGPQRYWRTIGRSPGRTVGGRLERTGAVRPRRKVGREAGLSALELLATLGVAAVLAGLAVPGFAAFRRSAGVSSAANELVWALHLARSSAVTRGQPVTVCLSKDDLACLTTSEGAADGWLVFEAAGQAVAVQSAPSGPILHRFRLPDAVAVQGSRPAVTFWPVARAGATSTFEICDLERRTPGRSIVVSQTGRPRVAVEAASCAL